MGDKLPLSERITLSREVDIQNRDYRPSPWRYMAQAVAAFGVCFAVILLA